MFRHPVRIALGATTDEVSGGKMQADGDDIRLVVEGVEQQRTVLTPNTSATYLWCVPAIILPGEAIDVEVWYGNSAATNPPVLAYPNLPAFNLPTSSNTEWQYLTDPTNSSYAGLGLWHLDRNIVPAGADFSIPGAWRPVHTLPNPNDGPRYQRAFCSPGAVFAFATLCAARRGADFDLGASQNSYDGIAISLPFPMTKYISDHFFYNENGVGQVVWLVRPTSGNDWDVINAITTTQAKPGTTRTNDTVNFPVGWRHLAVAVWPADGWTIADDDVDEIYWRMQGTTELTIDDTDLVITEVGSETEFIEIATEIRLFGGVDLTPPYTALRIGNAAQGEGEGTPRLGIASTEAVVVDCGTHRHEVYDVVSAAPNSILRPVPVETVMAVQGWDDIDATREAPVSEWLPLAPSRFVVPNGDFGADLTSWAVDTTAGGLTVSRTWASGVGGVADGALEMDTTAAAGSANATALTINSRRFFVGSLASVVLDFWATTEHANLQPLVYVNFSADDRTGETHVSDSFGLSPSTEYGLTYAVAVPHWAEEFQIGVGVRNVTGTQTGSVWFDDVRINAPTLIFRDEALSDMDVRVDLRGRWL
jgi:hypothetical protein